MEMINDKMIAKIKAVTSPHMYEDSEAQQFYTIDALTDAVMHLLEITNTVPAPADPDTLAAAETRPCETSIEEEDETP